MEGRRALSRSTEAGDGSRVTWATEIEPAESADTATETPTGSADTTPSEIMTTDDATAASARTAS